MTNADGAQAAGATIAALRAQVAELQADASLGFVV